MLSRKSERAIISEAATAAVVVFALRLPPRTYRLAQELLLKREDLRSAKYLGSAEMHPYLL